MPDEPSTPSDYPSGCPACGHAVMALEAQEGQRSLEPVGCTKAELFTKQEHDVLQQTRVLWEAFTKLPVVHQAEPVEFAAALHRIQDLVTARPMYRVLAIERAAQEQARNSRNGGREQ